MMISIRESGEERMENTRSADSCLASSSVSRRPISEGEMEISLERFVSKNGIEILRDM